MKKLLIIVICSILVGCGHDVTYEYYNSQINIFGYLAELKLGSDGSVTSTEIDSHAQMGSIARGKYKWHENVLVLDFKKDPNRRYLILQNDTLYRIEPTDSLGNMNFQQDEKQEFIKLVNKNFISEISKSERLNRVDWVKGHIKDFDKMVIEFKANDDNYFQD
ncbi:hypothetical protein [Fulvivirga sp.]|uniref:hypothetical protein n=1 Tax=Fulvivirga sp. TaxID=1931237 RepID=UPI0032EF7FCE